MSDITELNEALMKRKDENEIDYHRRLVYGKLKNKTLSDYDYSELSGYLYNKEYAPDVARRMMYGSARTLEALDKCTNDDMSESEKKSLESQIFELKKERQKFFDQRTAFNKVVRDRARQEELNEIIADAIKDAALKDFSVEDAIVTDISDNDLLVSLNDLHYGLTIDSYWRKYNSDVCREMISDYIQKIVEIKYRHDSENCIVWCNGDEISGNIHLPIQVANKENVIEQVIGVSELIANFLYELSKYFKTVKFVSVAGNHSRLSPNKDNAVQGERLDNLVGWYLEARLQNVSNIEFEHEGLIDDTMYVINVRGKNYVGVHGDFDPSREKIQSLQTFVGVPVYSVLLGHKHHNMIDNVQGIKVVMAGGFAGMDDYCVSKRIYGKPEQIVCVCGENGIECYYDIQF